MTDDEAGPGFIISYSVEQMSWRSATADEIGGTARVEALERCAA